MQFRWTHGSSEQSQPHCLKTLKMFESRMLQSYSGLLWRFPCIRNPIVNGTTVSASMPYSPLQYAPQRSPGNGLPWAAGAHATQTRRHDPCRKNLKMTPAGHQSSCVRTQRPGNSSRTRNLPGAVLPVPRLLFGLTTVAGLCIPCRIAEHPRQCFGTRRRIGCLTPGGTANYT